MKRSSVAALREDRDACESAYQKAKALALKCAAERDAALQKIDGLQSACKGYADTVIRVASERDALIRRIDEEREAYIGRIEALHADLRMRTDERDFARQNFDKSNANWQTTRDLCDDAIRGAKEEARKYAETRRLADDLQTEVAAAKIALAELNAEAGRWANIARDAVYSAGVIRGQLESLAVLTTKSGSAAAHLAEIILAETKPCTP